MSQIELILSRHGETEENKLHIMQGQLPGHLSELGKQQAESLAEMLDKEELDVIVCSDLARSYDTAMAVARRKGLQPVATPLLREMDWGEYRYQQKLRPLFLWNIGNGENEIKRKLELYNIVLLVMEED